MRRSTRTLRVAGGLSCVDTGGVQLAAVYTLQSSHLRRIYGSGSCMVRNRFQVVSNYFIESFNVTQGDCWLSVVGSGCHGFTDR